MDPYASSDESGARVGADQVQTCGKYDSHHAGEDHRAQGRANTGARLAG